MSRRSVGSIFVLTLLFGVLLSSGVEARRLHQSSLSIETNDGRQRGTVSVDGDGGVATATGTGRRNARASARVSTSPGGQTAQVGALGDDSEGNVQGVGAGISTGGRPAPAPLPPTPAGPRSSVSVGGTGTARVGGTGSTSVTVTGRQRTSVNTSEDEEEEEAPAVAPAVPDEDLEEESPKETEETPEPQPPMKKEEEVEVEVVEKLAPAPVPEEKAAPAPKETAPKKTAPKKSIKEEEEEEPKEVTASASVTVSTKSGKQQVTVDGKSGPKVCLTSDTSMLEELLDEAYEVTILTPTRLGYEISMIRRSGYATSETSLILDHVPEDVQELCNYDPETAPVPAKHLKGEHNERDATAVLQNLCESKMVLYAPRLLDVCWDAGYLTFFDLVVLG